MTEGAPRVIPSIAIGCPKFWSGLYETVESEVVPCRQPSAHESRLLACAVLDCPLTESLKGKEA